MNMTIERSSVANNAKAVASTEGAKGKTKSGDEADNSLTGGFFSILTSLDPSTDPGAGVAAPLSGQDAVLPIALPDSVPVNETLTSLPNEFALLLNQAGGVSSDKLSTTSDMPLVGRGQGGLRPSTH